MFKSIETTCIRSVEIFSICTLGSESCHELTNAEQRAYEITFSIAYWLQYCFNSECQIPNFTDGKNMCKQNSPIEEPSDQGLFCLLYSRKYVFINMIKRMD